MNLHILADPRSDRIKSSMQSLLAMSSLSWIVFDETERQRVRRIMALFDEKETRDELGMGSIRDSTADHLFPGTSTIQTRLRYMLFVPWIYAMVEEVDAPPE